MYIINYIVIVASQLSTGYLIILLIKPFLKRAKKNETIPKDGEFSAILT